MSSFEEFQTWVNTLPERVEKFRQMVPLTLRDRFDYSIDSLDVLENWLLNKYPDPETALMAEAYPVIDATGSYLGETFRRHLGGKWVIELEDEEYGYLGIPGIDGFRSIQPKSPVYPSTWITTAIDRRVGNFIRARVDRYLKDSKP